MLISDKIAIGLNLRKYRKMCNLTQIEVAEKANLSDRTYADIERGSANMRVDTLIKICDVLKITPNEILTIADDIEDYDEYITNELHKLSIKEKAAVSKFLELLLSSK